MPGPVAARKRAVTVHGHGTVKTAPYKAPVNGDPRKKQQKNTYNILQMFGL